MPYWRLSAFYFFYFAVLGVLAPYWGPYLESLGFGPRDIGVLMAIPLATKIVAPNIWGWFADTMPEGKSLLPLASVLALAIFATLFVAESFVWLALAMAGFSFFWNATLPSMEVITLNHLGDRRHRYGVVRLWGSVGFIALVLSMGGVIEGYGASMVLPAIGILLAGMCLSIVSVPGRTAAVARPVSSDGGARPLLQPHVIAFLFCCLLMQASHAPFYAFFTLYLEHYGYNKPLIGGLWALGVAAEIVVFICMHRLFRAYRITSLLLFSFGATVLRWILVAGFPEYLTVILLSQLLHAVTFGVYHASAIQMIHRLFTANRQHRGQALYSSMSFGVGGALGSLYSGYLWEQAGPGAIYVVAAVAASVSALVTWFYVRPAVRGIG
ncbi:MAG: putative 3-phenylpropionic acid transporter [Gammaproteobacteria bacterium]|nr:putative 3-phenylpropionic acid transporter [Gammaproteobacteria bacterium]